MDDRARTGRPSATSGGSGIGRIGALAVALGIGVAMVTGAGTAAADNTDSGTSSQDSPATGPDPATASHGAPKSGTPSVPSWSPRPKSADRAGQPFSRPDRRPTAVFGPRPPRAASATAGVVERTAGVVERTAKAVDGLIGAGTARRTGSAGATPTGPRRATKPAPTGSTEMTPGTATPLGRANTSPSRPPQHRDPGATVAAVPGVTAVRPARTSAVPFPAAAISEPATIGAEPATQPSTEMPHEVRPPALAQLTVPLRQALAASSTQWAQSAPLRPLRSALAMLTLIAAARRDPEPASSAVAQPTTSQTVPTLLAASAVATAQPVPGSLPSTPLGWVTGISNTGSPGAAWPQTNNTAGFNIDGTDLGIMWDNGQPDDTHYVLVAFGDTFSQPNMTGDWRSNVLLLSTDNNLSDGMSLLPTGPAYQFIPANSGALGLLFPTEVTVIPTSGVSVDARQYVNYMSVRSWDSPGVWTTNYSAISQYDPATDKWVLVPSTIRSAGWFRSSTPYVAGSQNFQQMAYVREPEEKVAEGEPRYVYAFGTPAGRQGSAYLSRVPEDDITDLSKYEYWDGEKWVAGKPAVAAPVIGESTKSTGLFGFVVDWANDPNVLGGYLGGLFGAKTGGNVSEMSVQYNEYLDKYVVLYADGNNDIQMRVADEPEGPWSEPITIATSAEYPGLYAPMIHPWSGTGALVDDNGDPDVSNLYWNMSLWGDYNVVLMQTDVSALQTVQV